jgi:putative RecB family exonuclease
MSIPLPASASTTAPESPAERISTPVDGVDVLGAISPSRAGDFMACPLMYRFRTIDRLPEPPSPDAVRGTVVHKVLEDLFDAPAAERTPERAGDMLVPTWELLLEADPGLAEMFGGEGPDLAAWLASCRTVLDRYFDLEDPRRLEPAERDLVATERKVEAIWQAIRRAEESGDWRPRRSRLCDWCSYQSICPEFGGTPPPLPVRETTPTPAP